MKKISKNYKNKKNLSEQDFILESSEDFKTILPKDYNGKLNFRSLYDGGIQLSIEI